MAQRLSIALVVVTQTICDIKNVLATNGIPSETKSEPSQDVYGLSSPDDTTGSDTFKCYCNSKEECLVKCLDDDDQRSFEVMFLITASQVVLGTAIIMGLSAIIMVLLRVCSRSRFNRNNQHIHPTPDELGRMGIRASLSSLQQRILSKLRDRPPKYETRHNYEYQRRERSTRIQVLNPGASITETSFPPPSYEAADDNSSVHELPPAYSITVEENSGSLNQTFVNDDNEIQSVRPEDSRTSTPNEVSDSRNRPNDTVLHI